MRAPLENTEIGMTGIPGHRLQGIDFGICGGENVSAVDAQYALPIVEVKREPLHLVFYRESVPGKFPIRRNSCGEVAEAPSGAGGADFQTVRKTAKPPSETMPAKVAGQGAGMVHLLWRHVEEVDKRATIAFLKRICCRTSFHI
jgi:hypothetical protein